MGNAVTTSISKDNYGNTIYEVHFYEDKFVFENLDISELDVERELGAFPYAIVRVEYRKPGPEALSECCQLQLYMSLFLTNLILWNHLICWGQLSCMVVFIVYS